MKRIIYIIIILLTIYTPFVFADVYDSAITDEVKEGINDSFETLYTETGLDIDALEMIDELNKGNFNFDLSGIMGKFRQTVFTSLDDNIKGFTRVLVLILLSSVISKVNFGIGNQKVSELVSTSVVLLGVLEIFLGISEVALKTIDSLTIFINSLIPVLITLLATGGKIITAKLFNPTILAASSVATLVIKTVIIPLSFVSLSLKLTYSATEKANVLIFSKHINSLIKWLIGLILTVYMGLVGLGGTVASNIDGTVLKTAKFAVGSFIPYVGGMLSESVELVLNSSIVVKNSLGIIGLVGVVGTISLPCVSLIIKVLLFKLIQLLATPLSDKNVLHALEGISDCAIVMLGMVLVVAVMYILSITVIINTGGA